MTYGVKSGDVSAVLNCGATFTNIVVVDGADVMLCRDVPAAGNLITSEISKAMSVSFEEAEALKISFSTGQNPAQEVQEVVRSAVDDLVSQIQKAFEFYTASSPDSPIQRIFVSGGTSQMSLFKETLKSAVNIPIEKLSPFVNIGYNSRAMSDQYIQQITPYSAVAIGLALRKVDEK
jgi:type IV pilus assembly protein PilM